MWLWCLDEIEVVEMMSDDGMGENGKGAGGRVALCSWGAQAAASGLI